MLMVHNTIKRNNIAGHEPSKLEQMQVVHTKKQLNKLLHVFLNLNPIALQQFIQTIFYMELIKKQPNASHNSILATK